MDALNHSESVAGILAELNLRYHIIDMLQSQKQIQDIVLVIDIPDDELCNLQSSIYERGMMTLKNQIPIIRY